MLEYIKSGHNTLHLRTKSFSFFFFFLFNKNSRRIHNNNKLNNRIPVNLLRSTSNEKKRDFTFFNNLYLLLLQIPQSIGGMIKMKTDMHQR